MISCVDSEFQSVKKRKKKIVTLQKIYLGKKIWVQKREPAKKRKEAKWPAVTGWRTPVTGAET